MFLFHPLLSPASRVRFSSSKVKVVLVTQLRVTLCNPRDYIACQTPLSVGFCKQEY